MFHKDVFRGAEMYPVYSVFVGGSEVCDYLVNLDSAKDISLNWLIEGYKLEEVWIRNYFTEEWIYNDGKKWRIYEV